MKTTFKLGNVEFKNRVLVASGTFGYGDEVADSININGLGGLITKSLTPKPREGNPPSRIVETASGMINSIGLANIGVEKFVEEKLPLLNNFDTVIVVNVAGSTVEEYCRVIEKLEQVEGIDAYEINVSCPNVKEGGLNFGTNVKATAEITKEVRRRTMKPVIVKLTPNVTRVSEFGIAAEAEGADAVSLINTLVGLAVDVKTRKPKISTVTGGLSGPAIKPVALAKVYEVVQALKIPVIGIGGIFTVEDALEFLIVGAVAVQVGTANFIDPASAIHIAEGIEKYCSENNIEDVQQIIGSLDTSTCIPIIKSWL
ncbi:MAG: dihydroorotate dehydrogenase [Bacteroidetes bacterium]|nr:dihydroorotate dehydrogenase [Bacteroidota bacterium]